MLTCAHARAECLKPNMPYAMHPNKKAIKALSGVVMMHLAR